MVGVESAIICCLSGAHAKTHHRDTVCKELLTFPATWYNTSYNKGTPRALIESFPAKAKSTLR